MKILHVTNHFYPCVGGIEKYVLDLSLELIEQGHVSDVLCLNSCASGRKKLPPKETYRGISILRIPYLNLRYYKIGRGFLRIAKDYDVIHIHGFGFFSDAFLLFRSFHRKPLVLSVHGGFFHTKSILPIKKAYMRWSQKASANLDAVLVHSKNDLSLFSQFPRLSYIPYAIRSNDFSGKRKEKDDFVYVGRLAANKRVDNVLRVFSHLTEQMPKSKLYIVCVEEGKIREDLENLASSLGISERVVFVRESGSHVKKYYKQCRYFLFASEYEAFGISVIEAMASGCVVVVNDIPSMRNIVQDGKDGYIVRYDDPASVAKRILDIRKKDVRSTSKNAVTKAQTFDWKHSTEKMIRLYRSVGRGV